MRVAIVVVSLFALSSTAAMADWQFTKWGMTKAQFEAVAKGRATFDAPKDGSQTAKGPYQVGDNVVEATYYFEGGRLEQVSLSFDKRSTCVNVGEGLKAKYGTPFEDKSNRVLDHFVWHDKPSNNRIELVGLRDFACDVFYRPLRDEMSPAL